MLNIFSIISYDTKTIRKLASIKKVNYSASCENSCAKT